MQNDEFFPEDPIPPELIEFDQLAIPRRVARKVHFEKLAASLNAILLDENSAIEAYVRIRNVMEILDVALNRLKEDALTSITGTTQEVLGVQVQVKALPRKWKYDDPTVSALEAEIDAIGARLKERRKFLVHLKQEVVDPATGEVIRPARCVSEGVTIQVIF